MNSKLLILSLGILSVVGCSSGDSPFTEGGGALAVTSTGIIAQKGFNLVISDTDPQAYDPTTGLKRTTLTLTVYISDRNDQSINDATHTITFIHEGWGSWDTGNQCITVNGTCSVDWTTGDIGVMPDDYKVAFTAYAEGEETFVDINKNGIFDNGDIYDPANPDHDIDEPFVDCDHDGSYNAADPIIDLTVPNDGHTLGDNLYNGANCQNTVLAPICSTTTLVLVSDRLLLDLTDVTDVNPALTDSSCD